MPAVNTDAEADARLAILLFVEIIADPHNQLRDPETLDVVAEVEAFIDRGDVRMSPRMVGYLRRIAGVVDAQMRQMGSQVAGAGTRVDA